MPLPRPEQLQDLSRDELIAVILVLMEQVRQLTTTVEQLRAENERLKHPPPTSQNSSQPKPDFIRNFRQFRRTATQGPRPPLYCGGGCNRSAVSTKVES